MLTCSKKLDLLECFCSYYFSSQIILNFVNHLLDSLDIAENRIRVGAIKFSTHASMLFYMDDFVDKEAIKQNISRTGYIGSFTNTPEALRLTRTE